MGSEVSEDGKLKLPEELTIHNIEETMNCLCEKMSYMHGVTIDASELRQIDACGLQVLLAWAKEAKVRKMPFVIVNPSTYLIHVLAITGAAKAVPLGKEN